MKKFFVLALLVSFIIVVSGCTRVLNPNIGNAGNEISYRYFPLVEDIYMVSQIVGQQASDDWYFNVYYKQLTEDIIKLPALYQMINHFGISKERLVRENENYIGALYHLDDYIINALYQEEALMMELLKHPLALYFDGEIYTYYEMRGNLIEAVQNIPSDVKAEYFALIEAKSETDETLRELKENIDAFWQSYETGIYP